MHRKNKILKSAALVLSAAVMGIFGTAGYYSAQLPETLTAEIGSELRLAEYPEITCGSLKSDVIAASETFPSVQHTTLSLFGAIPIKNVQVLEEEAPTLIAGGEPFGIKLLMDGVMVTELGEVTASDGDKVCPAAEAGIEVGDVIRLADMQQVSSNQQIQDIIAGSNGRKIKLSVNRGGSEFIAYLTPEYSQVTKSWMGGMWVRDSIAGIGTISFINKATGEFAGLGHPICDSDTGEIVPLQSGEAVPVEITDAKKGEKGIPGELHGCFTTEGSLGILDRNNSSGVFGTLCDEAIEQLCSSSDEFKMGYRQDIVSGPAEIITTIDGEEPKRYSIEIESVNYKDNETGKNMVIKITDKELLEKTGGIVQGMSGSPVIQNGKLIGAVTHVFVADPTKGYAIFAENMEGYLR